MGTIPRHLKNAVWARATVTVGAAVAEPTFTEALDSGQTMTIEDAVSWGPVEG
jgi:hypothetical protein